LAVKKLEKLSFMLNDKIIKELRSTTEVEEYYSKNFDFVFDSKFVMAESFP
jgi:hypothetical protein